MASVAETEHSSTTETEISQLKEKFGTDCRIIRDVGEFSYVIKVSLKQWNITLKFQLTSNYPITHPVVVVQGHGMEEIVGMDLEDYLCTHTRQQTVTQLVDLATTWLNQHGVPATQPQQSVTGAQRDKTNKKKKKNEKPIHNLDEILTTLCKKSSMKTAEDVVKRILWDSNLQSDDFTIGYLDRFLGVVEKGFINFSWEDLASVDYTALAIPKHRIQYFRYKKVKVWDKNERLDNVFGSTGSGITITDVIRTYEAENNVSADSTAAAAAEPKPVAAPFVINASDDDSSDYDDDDDSDDDGVSVTIGTGISKPSSHVAVDNDGDDDDDAADDDDDVDIPWQNKLRPNYFLCQRITSPEILETVAHMQDVILDRSSGYDACIVPPVALHVTLCTLGLDTAQLVQDAVQFLKGSREELKSALGDGLSIECSGVGNFYGRVIYGKVKHGKEFMDYVEHLRALVREAGLHIRDSHDFVPHMTILKVTRPAARLTGRRTLPAWMLQDFKDVQFGSQVIDGIYLCEMKAEKGLDGFYISPGNISFNN